MGNRKLIISVRRHEKREKPNEGITQEAYQRAFYYGALLRKEIIEAQGAKFPLWKCPLTSYVLGYHSDSLRTMETLDGILNGLERDPETNVNSEYFSGILNKKPFIDARIGPPHGNVKRSELLNEIEFDKNPDYQAERKKQPSDYDSQINFLLQHPDDSGKTETMEQSGQRVLRFIDEVCRYNKKIRQKFQLFPVESNLYFAEGVTHGPLVEAALIALVDPTIKDIRYLHGGLREGENFRIEIEGQKKKLYFKGECCDISKSVNIG